MPELVREYARPGKVRIVFRGLTFIGPDSEKALRLALAAGRQGRLWNVVHLLQEPGWENEGWVTDGLLTAAGRALPRPEVERALLERSRPSVDAQLEAAQTAAAENGVRGTPAFAASPTGGTLSPLVLDSLDAQALRPALDDLLAG